MSDRPFTAASFDLFLGEGRLMATRCTGCATLHLPPRAICPTCFGESLEWVETSGRGTLAAFTAIAIGPAAMQAAGYGRDNPYCSGIVALEEGVTISALILGVDARRPENIHIGQRLVVGFEPITGRTVLAFRPA
ncbi:MAG: OB-fold domain-containing protein [Anaerolineales bacterium]|nr:OB-fold domain-containing protein [Anaerolineales bacterium]